MGVKYTKLKGVDGADVYVDLSRVVAVEDRYQSYRNVCTLVMQGGGAVVSSEKIEHILELLNNV